MGASTSQARTSSRTGRPRTRGWTCNGTERTLSRFGGQTGGLGGLSALAGWTQLRSVLPVRPDRPVQTHYEHAWEIRDLLGFRDFTDEAEAEVTAFVASRVAMTWASRRELFDRAVLWLIENRVLLPGLSTLSRLVTEVRRVRLEALNEEVVAAAPVHMRRELIGTLAVPDGKRISTLDWLWARCATCMIIWYRRTSRMSLTSKTDVWAGFRLARAPAGLADSPALSSAMTVAGRDPSRPGDLSGLTLVRRFRRR